jgi:hypothetical protein
MANYYKRACDFLETGLVKDYKSVDAVDYSIWLSVIKLIGEERFNSMIETYPDFNDFHKSFRQCDVTKCLIEDDGNMIDRSVALDNLIWNLIFKSSVSQMMHYHILDKLPNGEDKEDEFKIFKNGDEPAF